MNREVLSKYDLMTVGECAGVTIKEAEKYASADGKELSMVFQFELVELASGKYGKLDGQTRTAQRFQTRHDSMADGA